VICTNAKLRLRHTDVRGDKLEKKERKITRWDSEMIEKRAEIDGYRINILVTHFLCYYILKVIQYIFRSQLFVTTLLPFPQKKLIKARLETIQSSKKTWLPIRKEPLKIIMQLKVNCREALAQL